MPDPADPPPPKFTPAELRARFENPDAVRAVSDAEKGQVVFIDAPRALALVARAAAACHPSARALLDVGCGAGNYTVRVLELLPGLDVTLLDLSGAMLDRAAQRALERGARSVETIRADLLDADLGEARFDVITAGAVLHHLRDDAHWAAAFAKLHRALRPGGGLWIADWVHHARPEIHALFWEEYGDYLKAAGGPYFRDDILSAALREDTPRPVVFQLDLLRAAGFSPCEVLHKNNCFALLAAFRGAS